MIGGHIRTPEAKVILLNISSSQDSIAKINVPDVSFLEYPGHAVSVLMLRADADKYSGTGRSGGSAGQLWDVSLE